MPPTPATGHPVTTSSAPGGARRPAPPWTGLASRLRAGLLPGLIGLVLGGCAAPLPAPPSPPEPVLAPNANLVVQGIPPIPMSLVRRVEKYTEFRGHGFVGWHPTRAEMLVSHRQAGASVSQLFRVGAALAEPEPLTEGTEPASGGSWEPREGRYLVFGRSSGGNEANQLYRLEPPSREAVLLTDPDERHAAIDWLHGSAKLIYSSVPLDRTAQGGSRAAPSTTLWLMDPLNPAGRRKLAELPGTGWSGGNASHDDRTLALTRYLSANESEIWTIDLASGLTKPLLPAAGETLKAAHFPAGFTADDGALFVVSDRSGEFRELMRLDLRGPGAGQLRRVTGAIPWDVENASLSSDGRRVAVRLNVDGSSELRLFDAQTLAALPASPLPAGSINTASFHPLLDLLAVALDSSRGPNQLYAIADGKAAPWTRPYVPPGIDTASFADQRIVRWQGFDGLSLSGVMSTPPARFTGRRPVVVIVHGGPEGQATTGFLGRWHYLINELGVAVIEPNVRGSSGYGKTFLALDNGFKREDSVKDLGALLDWIGTQPGLDASRVLVYGGSYGGYMSLAASVQFADRIAGAIDVVGISHFVTFLQNTESYRRDLRRVEYGDERDPAMRAFLEKISPLNNAALIRKPLFVVQGKNDPRVPVTEAEQIVARVRDNGTPVWYLRAENEGHGFRRKENADFQFYAMLAFMEKTLLNPP